jgi:uncharacterized protein YqeY
MSLQERIKKDLAAAMKAKDEEQKSILRVILGEFSRSAQKELSDADGIKVLKKLIKSEKEVLAQTGGAETNRFIQVTESYLPQMAAEAEIKDWIEANVDLTRFKNKMQAMGTIMKHFGERADGNLVRKVLGSL